MQNVSYFLTYFLRERETHKELSRQWGAASGITQQFSSVAATLISGKAGRWENDPPRRNWIPYGHHFLRIAANPQILIRLCSSHLTEQTWVATSDSGNSFRRCNQVSDTKPVWIQHYTTVYLCVCVYTTFIHKSIQETNLLQIK